MAQYLIVADDGKTIFRAVEAKNIKDAARKLITPSTYAGEVGDEVTALIWRVAGPPKTVTLKLTTSVEVEVSDHGEDE